MNKFWQMVVVMAFGEGVYNIADRILGQLMMYAPDPEGDWKDHAADASAQHQQVWEEVLPGQEYPYSEGYSCPRAWGADEEEAWLELREKFFRRIAVRDISVSELVVLDEKARAREAAVDRAWALQG